MIFTPIQIRQLLNNWEIDTRTTIEDTWILGGTELSDCTWTIGEKYIFKTGKNIAGLKVHIAISQHLNKNGFKAGVPVKTKQDEDFITMDDRFFVLTEKIAGDPLTNEQRYYGDRIEIGKRYGKAIGNLHLAFKKQDTRLAVNDQNLLDTVINWAMPETKRIMEQWECPMPEEFFTEYNENFPNLYQKLPKQIIHRDANPSNIIFNQGQVSGFVDFDISERNVRIFDPCYCATGILSEADQVVDGFEKWSEIMKGIVEGYDQSCKLTVEEKMSIPYVIYSIQMIFIAFLGNNEVYKKLSMQNRKMLVWIWENKEKCFGDDIVGL